jgi:hypothetical protein
LSDPTPPSAPFFILGTHGSGSTLLRLMLDSHERLAVPPETGVMRLVAAHRWTPWWELGGRWHHHLGMTEADVDAALGEMYGGMFQRYAAAQGKKRWGEKTPFHVWHVDDILRVFPDAALVVIVRHPLGSIGSVLRRFDRSKAKAEHHWLSATRELVRQAARVGDRMCFLRYEDLVREPEPVLRELLAWLGEPWSDAVLRHHEVQAATGSVEGGTKAGEAVDPGRVDRWRRFFDEDEQRRIVASTADWATLLGYADDPATPARPLAAAGTGRRMVFTGAELAARADRQTGLDRTPPKRPRADDPILPRGKTRRARALRQSQDTSDTARELFERLPPKLQRRVRATRRKRRGRKI